MGARKTGIAALLAAGVMLLGGCEMLEQEVWTPKESDAISVSEDGTITELIQETLDASYYDAQELKDMVTSEVQNYNGKNGADSVRVTTFENEGSTVKLELEYASAEDYAQFNNVEFYYGSMINAQLEGYLFDVSYKKVRDGVVQGSAVSGSEVIKRMDAQVMVVRAPLEVKLPGKVLFTSTNAEVLAADVVNATGKKDSGADEGLVLPSSAVYKGREATFDEEQAASRVYIIFETE